jgi:hypothetical protein
MTISGVREIKSPRREIDAERASPSAHAIDDPLRWSMKTGREDGLLSAGHRPCVAA